MTGKRIKQIAKIIKYGQSNVIMQQQMKPQIKRTTSSAINVLKQVAFENKIVSLSANQIGLQQRMFVYLKKQFLIPGKWNNYKLQNLNQYQAIILPQQIESSNQEFCHFQQCPSFQGMIFKIWAPMKIKVNYLSQKDLKQKKQRILQGFEGRIWDHEIRHLQGILPINQQVCRGQFFLNHEYKTNGYNIQIFDQIKKRELKYIEKNVIKTKQQYLKKKRK